MINHFSSPSKLPLRLYPTNKCNFRCLTPINTQFCDHIYEELDADLDSFVTISKKFFTTGLSDIVKISGREPTLYPNLVDLIHELKRFILKIMLSTNGTGSTSLMQSLIDGGVSIFALPFHTNNREKYIRMCGISGKTADRYFDHTQQIIAHLSEQKQEIHLIRVLMRGLNDSVEELDEFIEFCGKYCAMGKIFTLNYHPNLHRLFENTSLSIPLQTLAL